MHHAAQGAPTSGERRELIRHSRSEKVKTSVEEDLQAAPSGTVPQLADIQAVTVAPTHRLPSRGRKRRRGLAGHTATPHNAEPFERGVFE